MEELVKVFLPVIFLHLFSASLLAGADEEADPVAKGKSQLYFKTKRVELDLMLFRVGASIDFGYNETTEFPGELVSSPGCPKSNEGRPWVYYGSPVKCYLVGFKGPCPYGKRMFSVPNSKYGVCNCECFAQEIKIGNRPSFQNPMISASGIIDYNSNDISQNLLLYPRRRVRSGGT